MIRKKILLLGDFHVGKTSLIRQYVEKSFSDTYLTTLGVKISRKSIEYKDESYELLIWDIEGATPQKRIPTSYLKGASGVIFVGDVTRNATIGSIKNHIIDIRYLNPDIIHVIAYNKIDLLTPHQRENFPLEDNALLVSAKEDINVEALFTKLFEGITK